METMQPIQPRGAQQGFTIIELVVVILLLGILTATALPRFMDVTDEAHQSVVDGVQGGLQTGVSLFRAQWVAQGQSDTALTFDGATLFANGSGYPIGPNAGTSDDEIETTACLEIYNGLLQTGRPLAVSASQQSQGTPLTATQLDAAVNAYTGSDTNPDFMAVLDQDDTEINASTGCTFYYVGQYKDAASNGSRSIPTLNYDFTTGAVTEGTFPYEL